MKRYNSRGKGRKSKYNTSLKGAEKVADTAIEEKKYLSPIAQDICERRYFIKDENGKVVEDWQGLVQRVVNHVCKNEPEEKKKKITDLMLETKFLPNSPCLHNAGRNSKSAGLNACYVTKAPSDCWSDPEKVGMIENIANFGHIARAGGGAGVSLSNIRPEGDPVFGSTHAKACGPIEHMRMISEVMTSITQSGFRAMACISTLKVDHPDIFKFITCKQRARALKTFLRDDQFGHFDQMINNLDPQTEILLDKFIHNFNISVMVTDDFMEKVEKDDDFELKFNGKVYKTVKARDIFDAIVQNTWNNGDPGILFYDRINDCPYKYSGQTIEATNPCSEEPLPSAGNCNLASIDISKFYDAAKNDIDWKNLKNAIWLVVRFLDNVIDISHFPTKEFEKTAKKNRPIGLGIMGFADLLLKMKMRYGRKRSLEVAEDLAKFFYDEAHKASVSLAKERGTPVACCFPELEHRRNITLLSIAPTGSISQIAGCSGGIEPIFSTTTVRCDNTGKRIVDHPDSDKSYFRCAVDPEKKDGREVLMEEHIFIQAAFQKHVDAAISKTINVPNDATVEDIKKAYISAWRKGVKGITIYRDRSKSAQVLNTADRSIIQSVHAAKRPRQIEADIFRTTALGMDWHVIVGKVDDNPYEIFAVNGSQSLPEKGHILKHKRRHYSLLNEDGETLIDNLSEQEKNIDIGIDKETRRFSLELRHGIAPKYIVEQIDKSNDVVTSFAKAVSRMFRTKYIPVEEIITEACPECAKNGRTVKMIPGSGCSNCPSCYFSKCG